MPEHEENRVIGVGQQSKEVTPMENRTVETVETTDEAAREPSHTLQGAPELRGENEAQEGYAPLRETKLLNDDYRQRQQLVKELQELKRKIEASEGHQVHTRLNFLKESWFIFEGNYLKLRDVTDEYELSTAFLELWDGRNRGKLNLFGRDINRLFHNYLAGAASLLYTLAETIPQGTSFTDEYQERLEQQFRNPRLPHFIEDLGTYTRQAGLPLALAEIRYGGRTSVEVDSAIKLDAPELRKWEKWSHKGREYLDRLDNKAKLINIVDEYTSIVADFYEWFVKRQHELHRGALQELQELEGKREQLQQELEGLENSLELVESIPGRTIQTRQRSMGDLESGQRRFVPREQEPSGTQRDANQPNSGRGATSEAQSADSER